MARGLWIRDSILGSLLTLISPSVATVQGKVQFLGGRFRSENLHYQMPSVQVLLLLRALGLLRYATQEKRGSSSRVKLARSALQRTPLRHAFVSASLKISMNIESPDPWTANPAAGCT